MKTTALITGASMGIGLELAREFAKHGHNVVLVARTVEALNQLKHEVESEYGVRAYVIPCDLSQPNVGNIVLEEVQSRGIDIDILVNNAGLGSYGAFSETDWALEKMTLDVNIDALVHLCKVFLPGFKEKGKGKILNIASLAAFQPGPYLAVYAATKHFVLAFSEALQTELKGTGVSVTALCPGVTETHFFETAHMRQSNLVKGRKLPTAREVARYGYRALNKGKVVAVPGIMNRCIAFLVRFVPKSIIRTLAGKMIRG